MCERCKSWLVFSTEERGFSFKEARGKDERKKRIELDEKINILVSELERKENVREKAEVEEGNLREEVDRVKGESGGNEKGS